MAEVTITPACLTGEVIVPSSKSLGHRAVICAGLAEGVSRIERVSMSDDIDKTIRGMEALGAAVCRESDSLLVNGTGTIMPVADKIDCGESGSTLRFLIPLALTGRSLTFTGKGKLVERPLATYHAIFEEQDIPYQSEGGRLPLTVSGALKPGVFQLRGDVSSQFISGLLFALPRLAGDSRLVLTTELESKGYVDLTIDVMARFGVTVTHEEYREFYIPGNQRYQNTTYRVEGDYSQAAFWLAAGTLGAPVRCAGLDNHSLQGDKAILDVLEDMGSDVLAEAGGITARPARTRATVIDAAQCPDLVPVLATLAAVSEGTTRIIRAGRLRLKESDRLAAIAKELNKLGADVREEADSLTIIGKTGLTGGVVDSWHDHRIAMALAVASVKCGEPVTIRHSECVNKSYPHFWRDFERLGGKIDERCLG